MIAPATRTTNGKRLVTQQSVNQVIKNVCDILRRSNVGSAIHYVPELTWMLFLRILDQREAIEAEAGEAVSAPFTPSIEFPYRWQDWASPGGPKRVELERDTLGSVFSFVNEKLLPYLKDLENRPNPTPRQKIISEALSGVARTRVDTERNLLDVIDRLDQVRLGDIDDTHIFALSQVYEGLLLRMGERNSDGGQFFTPREIIRSMVQVVNPRVGETVYDPCCGTGGFLAQSYEYMYSALKREDGPEQVQALKQRTFYGREKEDLIYPIALANLVLHGIDEPHIWHGNTLTGQESYGGLFVGAPNQYSVILTNPPFGGKEGLDAQTRFPYKTGATQVLFLQHVIDSLAPGGRCGIVVDEGVLFRTNETAFVQTKRKLLDECDLYCVVSLPGGVFTAAGAGVKTNLLFFTKGSPTEQIWYYDLSDLKVGKNTPFTIDKLEDFFRLFPTRANSDRSWTVQRADIEAKNYDLKAVNPTAKAQGDIRTPEELLDIIEAKGREVAEALAALRALS